MLNDDMIGVPDENNLYPVEELDECDELFTRHGTFWLVIEEVE